MNAELSSTVSFRKGCKRRAPQSEQKHLRQSPDILWFPKSAEISKFRAAWSRAGSIAGTCELLLARKLHAASHGCCNQQVAKQPCTSDGCSGRGWLGNNCAAMSGLCAYALGGRGRSVMRTLIAAQAPQQAPLLSNAQFPLMRCLSLATLL